MDLTLPALPYELDALAPHVSSLTLELHHGRHHAGYLEKTRNLVRGTQLEHASLEDIVAAGAQQTDRRLFQSAAQAWNHAFYWRCMKPGGGGEARGRIADMIRKSFGSHESFSQQFLRAASNHFGSGWAWLVQEPDRLAITTTADADTPLGSLMRPLLTLDLWEHAYYVDYHNRRVDYVAAFLAHLANWEFAAANLAADAPADDARRGHAA